MRRSDSPEYRQALVEEMALQDIKRRMGDKITLNPKRDRFGYDTKDPKWAVMESILSTIPPNIANRLDNTELPMTMAEQLIEYTNGDANAALQIVEKLNTQFNKTAQGNERVGDYWDYWTKSLPAIYNKK